MFEFDIVTCLVEGNTSVNIIVVTHLLSDTIFVSIFNVFKSAF